MTLLVVGKVGWVLQVVWCGGTGWVSACGRQHVAVVHCEVLQAHPTSSQPQDPKHNIRTTLRKG